MTSTPRPWPADVLDLAPHPEGGWFRRTWRSGHEFLPDGYPGARPAATGILYLLDAGEESRWHRVRSDELWLWHRGRPLELLLGGDGATPAAEPQVTVLGPDIAGGQAVQALVPAGSWQSARPAGDEHDGHVLVSCVVSPGFDFADFELR